MKHLETVEQYEELKNSGKHIFLFSAEWCKDCRFIEPFMPEVEEKYSEYTFVYVNRDQFIDLCINQDVYGIPSFIAFEGGRELGRFVNKEQKTQEEIEAYINNLK